MSKKEYPLFRIRAYGIKCDNPDCNWQDMSVKQEDYADWVDKPCPCCGENLMTRQCYENTLAQTQAAEALNTLLNAMIPEDKNYASMNMPCDKDGYITDVGEIIPINPPEGYDEELDK